MIDLFDATMLGLLCWVGGVAAGYFIGRADELDYQLDKEDRHYRR
jgi:hypothetical protein